ncbi:MAG: hypothetical protein WC292_00270 [Clostridia bacterium]
MAINKMIIYNDTPTALADDTAVASVLGVIKEKTKNNNHITPYLVGDVVVTVIENKRSTTFRVAKAARK